jgi:thioredoxin reductase
MHLTPWFCWVTSLSHACIDTLILMGVLNFDINRKTINVDTEKFVTSEPGIYAIGDIIFYPGKKNLNLCGFHEAALAAFAIKQRIAGC